MLNIISKINGYKFDDIKFLYIPAYKRYFQIYFSIFIVQLSTGLLTMVFGY